MAGNRRKATQNLIRLIQRLAPKTDNWKHWQTKFNNMTDKEFHQYIEDMKTGKVFTTILAPNGMDTGITVENCRVLAKEMGYDFFQRVWVRGKDGEPDYLTKPALILKLPNRRQSQVIRKKLSVPKGNTINAMTGQPTGDSKGARTSFVETQLGQAMGLKASLVEVLKDRGGDSGARAAMNGMLSTYGRAQQSQINQFSSGVVSTKTLKSFMTAAHIKTTL